MCARGESVGCAYEHAAVQDCLWHLEGNALVFKDVFEASILGTARIDGRSDRVGQLEQQITAASEEKADDLQKRQIEQQTNKAQAQNK